MKTVEDLFKDFPVLFSEMRRGDSWIPKGWMDIVYQLSKDVSEFPEARVVQIKEKFGGLRYYMSSVVEGVSPLIREAENKADITCQGCGKPGTLRTDKSWIKVRCDECNDRT